MCLAPARHSHHEVIHSLAFTRKHPSILNKLHGSSSAVATKSIKGYREVLDAASAVVVGQYPTEDQCWNCKKTKNIQKEWYTFFFEAHQQCCSSEKKYNHNKIFCKFYVLDEPETDDSDRTNDGKISEGIAFDAEDSTKGGIDCTMCHEQKCDADDDALDVIKE